jgi:hypothetical protein
MRGRVCPPSPNFRSAKVSEPAGCLSTNTRRIELAKRVAMATRTRVRKLHRRNPKHEPRVPSINHQEDIIIHATRKTETRSSAAAAAKGTRLETSSRKTISSDVTQQHLLPFIPSLLTAPLSSCSHRTTREKSTNHPTPTTKNPPSKRQKTESKMADATSAPMEATATTEGTELYSRPARRSNQQKKYWN